MLARWHCRRYRSMPWLTVSRDYWDTSQDLPLVSQQTKPDSNKLIEKKKETLRMKSISNKLHHNIRKDFMIRCLYVKLRPAEVVIGLLVSRSLAHREPGKRGRRMSRCHFRAVSGHGAGKS